MNWNRCGKERLGPNLKLVYYLSIYLEGLEKTKKYRNEYNGFLGRDLNSGRLEDEAGILTT